MFISTRDYYLIEGGMPTEGEALRFYQTKKRKEKGGLLKKASPEL